VAGNTLSNAFPGCHGCDIDVTLARLFTRPPLCDTAVTSVLCREPPVSSGTRFFELQDPLIYTCDIPLVLSSGESCRHLGGCGHLCWALLGAPEVPLGSALHSSVKMGPAHGTGERDLETDCACPQAGRAWHPSQYPVPCDPTLM
jgi:hypothetical protein